MWNDSSSIRKLFRGLSAKCPLCGQRHLFTGLFDIAERCPRCGFEFARESGQFTGGWMMNLIFCESLLFIELMYFIYTKAQHQEINLALFLIVALSTAALLPLLLFRISRTTWIAIELIFEPPSEREKQEAAKYQPSFSDSAPPATTD